MISPTQLTFATQTAYSILNSSSNKCKSSSPGGGPAGASSGGDTTDLSAPAKLFGDLNELAARDPAKFKELASALASRLHQAAGAGDAGGPGNSSLAGLAAALDQAARTGDPSGLLPSAGADPTAGIGTYDQQGRLKPSPS